MVLFCNTPRPYWFSGLLKPYFKAIYVIKKISINKKVCNIPGYACDMLIDYINYQLLCSFNTGRSKGEYVVQNNNVCEYKALC